jgi:hypothetical protein
MRRYSDGLKPHLIISCLAMIASPAAAQDDEPFELISAQVTPQGVQVAVPTGGCTEKRDIQFTVEKIAPDVASIRFTRLVPDDCKGSFPEGQPLSYNWAELGLTPHVAIRFVNPVRRG